MTNHCSPQEVFFNYNGLNPIQDTMIQKMYPMVLASFQIIELTSYMAIHRYVQGHHRTMLNNQIISRDLYQTRKHKHLFSFYAQIGGFVVEVIYLMALTLVKVLGRKLFSKHSVELLNYLRATEFGVTATVQVFMSPDLRQRLIDLLQKI